MRRFLIIFALFIFNFSFSQTSNLDTLNHLYGAIAGKYGITMNVFIHGSQVKGSMYYNRVGQYIYLNGSFENGHMNLVGSLKNGQKTDFFDGTYDGKIYSGKWHTVGNKRVLNFKLQRTDEHWVLTKKKIWQVDDSVKKDNGWVHLKMVVVTNLPKAYPIPKAGSKVALALKQDLEENYNLSSSVTFKEAAQDQFNEWKESVREAEEDSYNELSDLNAFDSSVIYVSDCYDLFMSVKYEDIYKDPQYLSQYSFYYEVYDLYSGNEVTIDDLFTSSKTALKKVIIPVLLKHFKQDYQEDLTNYISVDDIDMPDSFAFTPDGVEFVYNPESLQATKVAYSFVVPYSQLLPYFQASFRKRFAQ